MLKSLLNATAIAVVTLSGLGLGGCSMTPGPAVMDKLPIYTRPTSSQSMLGGLPPPERPISVAVYGFTDQTGQFKQTNTGQNLSRAISQGTSAMLMRSLQSAGNRSWFTIVEREQLRDVLNERQLIRDMRKQYLGEKEANPQALPALLFAGVLLEGGVVGYDTNTITGGVGATLLGLGATGKYQQDTVTVYLRAVSVRTGEVLTTITASKTITSYAVDTNIFRYVSATSLLESENGFTTNEPGLLALQQAIDKAVYGLVMEGVNLRLWNFAAPQAGAPALLRYNDERDGILSPEQVLAAEARDRKKAKRDGPSARLRLPGADSARPPAVVSTPKPGVESAAAMVKTSPEAALSHQDVIKSQLEPITPIAMAAAPQSQIPELEPSFSQSFAPIDGAVGKTAGGPPSGR